MKYEVPEINISKFSVENIVTVSATGKVADALMAEGISVAETNIVKTTLNDWVEVQ